MGIYHAYKLVIRRIYKLYKHVGIILSILRGYLRFKQSFIRRDIEGTGALAQQHSVAVFIHWEAKGFVHPYVVHYLEALREAGFSILFVTNAPKLPERSIEILKPLCMRILWRKNVGYDFGAYKEAVLYLEDQLPHLDRLMLANDSVYGPLMPLNRSLQRADPALADVWSMTDSWERRYHLQSYFLLLYPRALKSQEFLSFWKQIRYVNNKAFVISKYELGFTRAMLRGGLNVQALYPYEEIVAKVVEAWGSGARNTRELRKLHERTRAFVDQILDFIITGMPVNPTHFLWDQLVLRMGFPFVKRELLTQNPGNVPWLALWESIVQQASEYDTRMIRDHLKAYSQQR